MYEELQTSDAPAHLVSQYEEVISALMTDVKKMESETKKMEEKFARYYITPWIYVHVTTRT